MKRLIQSILCAVSLHDWLTAQIQTIGGERTVRACQRCGVIHLQCHRWLTKKSFWLPVKEER
jgi:hypothetical protein